MKKILFLFALAFLFAGCFLPSDKMAEKTVYDGALLFVSDTTGMGQAISASTSTDSLNFTHVAIVEMKGKDFYVAEALPRKGVVRSTFDEFFRQMMADNGLDSAQAISLCRLYYVDNDSVDMEHLHAMLDSLVGRPYDDYFLPENDRYYCSELATSCYRTKAGVPLFSLVSMNFLDSEGNLPEYWKHHFDSLGVDVPQGVSGSNPNQLSQSDCLKVLPQDSFSALFSK